MNVMFSKNFQALLILIIQGLTIAGIVIAPYFELGYYDFSLLPFKWHKAIGMFINFFGLIFLGICLKSMKSNFEVRAKPRDKATLVTQWPFSWVRNPIYLVVIILGLGWSLSFWSIWSLILTILLYFVLLKKISLEEEFLLEKFGIEYQNYLKKVPKLFPKLF